MRFNPAFARSRAPFALSLLGLLTLSATLQAGTTTGPDVIVQTLGSTSNYGTAAIGDQTYIGYSVGTTSCNIGSEPVWWCDNDRAYCEDEQHPVIAQNLYRLKDDRFTQVGMSWLKHGFLSTNSGGSSSGCGNGVCQIPPHGGDQLGLGCLDTYGSGLNGSTPLGMRSEVNATTGFFPFPETMVATTTVVDQRVRVDVDDVEPALNTGAIYWVEGQYVTADDAAAGNGLNNASYRRVTVASGSLSLSLQDSTVREQAAIFAWQAVDPSVQIKPTDFSDGGIVARFNIARKAIENGPGDWHYEFAVHNMNSQIPAIAFEVHFAGPATISGAGFHDVDQHSGEPWDTTDWTTTIDGPAGSVRWNAPGGGLNANGIRWGTTYSFWFDSDLGPTGLTTVIERLNPLFVDGFESGDTSAW